MVPPRPLRFATRAACLALGYLGLVTLAAHQEQSPSQTPSSQAPPPRTPYDTPDIGKALEVPRAGDDYERREVKIPMRDGVSLFTVIVVPKGATGAPMLLTRTPYNAGRRSARAASPRMLATLPQGDEVFVAGGYIRVFQDVRGKYGSDGDYVVTRPLRGPLNGTATDHSTDAYDRNPQTFVPNIFFAESKAYVKATQRVYRAGATASVIELPLVPAATARAAAPSAPGAEP